MPPSSRARSSDASLVVRALASLAGEPPPRSARERRDCWERAGVVIDELSCCGGGPPVCLSGFPNQASRTLLARLAGHGAGAAVTKTKEKSLYGWRSA
jgi:hypothetical protein